MIQPRTHTFTVVLITALGLWWLVVGFLRPVGDYGVETDFYWDFGPGAREWLDHGPHALSGFRGPGFYLAIAGGEALGLDGFTAGKAISSISAASALAGTYALLSAATTPLGGLAAILFLASNPTFAQDSIRACSDVLAMALAIWTLWVVWRRSGSAWWILAGTLAGLAWLTRYSMAWIFPAAGLACLIRRRPWTEAGAFLLGALLVMVPWHGFLWSTMGDPFWNLNWQNLAVMAYAGNPNLAVNRDFLTQVPLSSLHDVLTLAPHHLVSEVYRNLWTHGLMDVRTLLGFPWAIACALGWGLATRVKSKRAIFVSWAATGFMAYVNLLPAFYNPRFSLVLLPFWGLGIAIIVAQANKRWLLVPILVPLLVTAIGSNVKALEATQNLRDPSACPMELKKLAEETEGQIPAGSRVLALKPHFPYLVGGRYVNLVPGTAGEWANSADYLLVSSHEVIRYPGLSPMILQPEAARMKGLELVKVVFVPVPPQGTRGAALYRITAEPSPPESASVRTIPEGSLAENLLEWLARTGQKW